MPRIIGAALILFAGGLLAHSGWALDIISCGQRVPDGQVGVLQADLACPSGALGVDLGDRATLQMNGHALRMNDGTGINCNSGHQRICTIIGPGSVSGAFVGLNSFDRAVVVQDVNFDDNPAGYGIYAAYTRLSLTNVSASRNEYGIAGFRVTGTTITTSDNTKYGLGVFFYRVTGLTATGNGDAGIPYGHGVLINSTITGNNGLGQAVDIASQRGRVHLVNSICDHSAKIEPDGQFIGETLHICMDDPP